MEDSEKERKPFFIEFKSNYGTTDTNKKNTPSTSVAQGTPPPTKYYCLHGHTNPTVEVSHCHRERSEGVDKKARRKLIIASVLCLLFMIAEIIGGVLSNSLAIATDAAHLLTDFAAFMISLFAIWLAGRPSTQRMSFGWYRAEVIGALVSVLLIWGITAILIWLAINRIINQTYELEADIMLITSGLGILFNIIMGFQLQHGHGHSHGDKETTQTITLTDSCPAIAMDPISDSNNKESVSNSTSNVPKPEEEQLQQLEKNGQTVKYNIRNQDSVNLQINDNLVCTKDKPVKSKSKRLHFENMNVRAAFIHVVGDVVQSIGVFVAALIIFFKPEWGIVDPICTFIFSIIVLFTTFKIVKDAVLVLMEATPDYLHYTEVMNIFLSIDGVERVHNLRIWALSVNKCALSAHLVIRPDTNPKKILQQANSAVHLKYNFFETTLQIEDFTPEMEECKQCVVPTH